MKVFKPIGSKERFTEIFQRVNKVQLNEDFGQSFNPQAVLDVSFNQLKSGALNIERSNSQAKGEISFVELVCTDKQGNNITFTFKVNANSGDQEGVYNVNGVIMTSFTFDSATDDESVEMDEKGLQQFNAQHGSELFDVIDQYIDVEESEPIDSLYEDAIKKIDSYPFGGTPERMQTNKAYGDEKPTNPVIRTKAPELQKFAPVNEYDKPAMKLKMQPMVGPTTVAEEVIGEPKPSFPVSTKSPVDALSPEKKKIFHQAYHNLTRKVGKSEYAPSAAEINAEIQRMQAAGEIGNYSTMNEDDEIKLGDYPIPMGKKFKPKEHYPKKRKKPTTSVKLSENEDDEYEEIPDLEIPTDKRAARMAKHDISGAYDDKDKVEVGSDFHMDEKNEEPETGDDEVANTDFIDTERQGLQGDEMDNGEDQISHQSMDNEPEGDDKPVHGLDPYISDKPVHGLDPYISQMGGMSHEPESDEIEQIAQDKEEAGEMIPGGKGEGKSLLEFSPDQILKGMRVEMEHTNDPMIALEITLDHLTEDELYYGEADQNPELLAQANAANDAMTGGEEGDDKNMEDILLGFKPHNVGDEPESDKETSDMTNPDQDISSLKTSQEKPEEVDEEQGFEEYNGNIGDRYADEDGNEFVVKDKVKGGVTLRGQSGEKEIATRDLQFMKKLNESENDKINNLITEEQIKIAKITLSNRKVPTGMTKKEAVQILMNNNLKKIL
ncbi:MAG: hypothetical protein WC428_00560 [Candidatus Paceibacterota bacterium]